MIDANNGTSMMEYDVISGTGWGSLNARILSSYPKGEEEKAITALINFWNETRS